MKIVFFGTPLFSAKVLEFLLVNNVTIVSVISKPDKPKGRTGHPVPTSVKHLINEKYPYIPIYQPEIVSKEEFLPILQACQADLFIVVAYGEILKESILKMPRLACINLHASLLPKYRGAAPIQRSIMEGEKETGITIMHMVKKMDAGDMIKQVAVPISPNMIYGELEEALCDAGKTALLDVIREYERGIPNAVPQDVSKVTFAPKIELEDCEINWAHSAQSIHDLIRGVNPHPGAWCFVKIRGEKKRLKLNRSLLRTDRVEGTPGSILQDSSGELLVSTGNGVLQIVELQLEGKKVMRADEFLRGIGVSLFLFT